MSICDHETAIINEHENAKAIRCATEQATTDLPTMEVTEARVSSSTNPFPHAHMLPQSPRWYVTVTIQPLSNGETVQALYHVRRSEGVWKAAHVGQVLPKKARRG